MSDTITYPVKTRDIKNVITDSTRWNYVTKPPFLTRIQFNGRFEPRRPPEKFEKVCQNWAGRHVCLLFNSTTERKKQTKPKETL